MSDTEIIKYNEEMNQEMIKQQISLLTHRRKKNKAKKKEVNNRLSILRKIINNVDEELYNSVDDVKRHCEKMLEDQNSFKELITSSTALLLNEMEKYKSELSKYETNEKEKSA